MSLFRCAKCACGEDTALCRYWSARVRNTMILCSACDPKIGKWHDEFPREPFAFGQRREIERFLEQSWVLTPTVARLRGLPRSP